MSGDEFGEHSETMSPAIERRIKDCYQYNQTVSETADFSQKIIKASSNIAKITGSIIANTNPEASRAMYIESLNKTLDSIKFNGENLKAYLNAFPSGFEPSNNFLPEMCATCESRYTRPSNFKCKPHATPVYQRSSSLTSEPQTMVLQSSINAD
jgi:hypothetical protein